MNFVSAAVSATAGLACLAGFVSLWFFAEQTQPRIALLLLLAGMTGVAATATVRPLRWVVNQADRGLQHFSLHWIGIGIAGTVWVLAVTYVVIKFKRNQISGFRFDRSQGIHGLPVMAITALLPLTVPLIPGGLGDAAGFIVFGPANLVGWGVAQLLGML